MVADQQYGFKDLDRGVLQIFIACDEVTLVNVEDGADTALVKTLEETDLPAESHPGFRAVKKSGKNTAA